MEAAENDKRDETLRENEDEPWWDEGKERDQDEVKYDEGE